MKTRAESSGFVPAQSRRLTQQPSWVNRFSPSSCGTTQCPEQAHLPVQANVVRNFSGTWPGQRM